MREFMASPMRMDTCCMSIENLKPLGTRRSVGLPAGSFGSANNVGVFDRAAGQVGKGAWGFRRAAGDGDAVANLPRSAILICADLLFGQFESKQFFLFIHGNFALVI